MKNFKKITLALIVGVMAIGFSSFTNTHSHKKGSAQVNYYFSKDGTASHTVSNYIYDLDGSCGGGSVVCEAQWSTTNAPIDGDSPAASGAPSYVGNTTTGAYQPGN